MRTIKKTEAIIMQNNEIKTIEEIKKRYTERETSKLDRLKALDQKVRRPAKIFAYVFGSIGSLILGTGMCLAMKTIFANRSWAMPVGIAIGVVGIAMVSVNYALYKKILSSRKKKYANEVLTLSDELLQK